MSSSNNDQNTADKVHDAMQGQQDPLLQLAESKNTAEAEEHSDPKLEKIEAKEEEKVHKLETEAQPTG